MSGSEHYLRERVGGNRERQGLLKKELEPVCLFRDLTQGVIVMHV